MMDTVNQKYIIFDIETAPLPNLEEMVAKLYPFEKNAVKVGNRKDPEKIAAFIKEANSEHFGKLMDKAQLDPALSYVCAIGILRLDDDEPELLLANSVNEEPDILRALMDLMNGRAYTAWVGFNCMGFDLEFIWKRCWINNIPTSPLLRRGRYWEGNRVKDLMLEWMFYNNKNQMSSLDKVAKTLGVSDPDRPDEISGKDFYKALALDRGLACQYLTSDLKETRDIARRIL